MAILVLAEHDNTHIKESTRHTLSAAAKLGGEITLLVAGAGCASAAQAAAKIAGVARVWHCDDAAYGHGLAENIAWLAKENAGGFTHILAPATTFGKNVMPRLAALLDVQALSEIITVESADTFKRPIYAGNAIATVRMKDKVKVLTVRATAFPAVPAEGGSGRLETLPAKGDYGRARFVSQALSKSDRPELTSARIVISGGRGMGSGENFRLIEAVADKLNAAVGASRAAVDSGFVPNDFQVGQTGKIVAPDLYIAVGISGAIQHLAGCKDSKVIVAINKDEEAPIFQVADYGLVADLFQALPELAQKL